jgi:hypothetical protein
VGTNSSSAPPSPAGYCFVCHGERVHDTARAITATEAKNFGAPEVRQRYRNGGGWDQPSLPPNSSGNLARAYNDLATKLYVIC